MSTNLNKALQQRVPLIGIVLIAEYTESLRLFVGIIFEGYITNCNRVRSMSGVRNWQVQPSSEYSITYSIHRATYAQISFQTPSKHGKTSNEHY